MPHRAVLAAHRIESGERYLWSRLARLSLPPATRARTGEHAYPGFASLHPGLMSSRLLRRRLEFGHFLAPEAQWRLAGGVAKRNHRYGPKRISRPGGTPDRSGQLRNEASPAPLQGAVEFGVSSGGCASLHHRLISPAPPALMVPRSRHLRLLRRRWGRHKPALGHAR